MGTQIVRTWAGVTTTVNAEAYLEHLRAETLPHLRDLDGFVGAEVLRRDLDHGEVRFVVQTRWQSMQAIRAFAGDTLDVAVVPPAAQAVLRRYDDGVEHYTVALDG